MNRHTSIIAYFDWATAIFSTVPKDSKVHNPIVRLVDAKGNGFDDWRRENREEQQGECYEQQDRQRRCWPQHGDGRSALDEPQR